MPASAAVLVSACLKERSHQHQAHQINCRRNALDGGRNVFTGPNGQEIDPVAGQALAALLEARARSQMGGAPGPMGPMGPMGAPPVMMNPMMVGGFNPMMMHPAMGMGGEGRGVYWVAAAVTGVLVLACVFAAFQRRALLPPPPQG